MIVEMTTQPTKLIRSSILVWLINNEEVFAYVEIVINKFAKSRMLP